MSEENLCVLIDFENIAAGTEKEGLGRFNIRTVMNRLKEKGRILVTRAYGDWGRYSKFKQSLLEQGVSMMELTSYRGQEKNRADIALVVDAMELAFTRDYLNTYVLLSGDSDFTPLVMRLKELNKRVIGIGTRGSTSRLLAESCDEFIFYENLKRRSTQQTEEERPKDKLTLEEAFKLMVETIEGMQKDRPGPVRAGTIKQSMLRKHPTFDEGEYGYPGFTRFVKSAEQKKFVNIIKDEAAGGVKVDLPSDDDHQPDMEAGTLEAPKLDGDALRIRELLHSEGFNPTSHMIRHTVVHELIEHVQERRKRKKRNTLRYVYADIQRRCRSLEVSIKSTHIRHIISAMKAAGLLLHPAGAPVRSENAQFTIKVDAEEALRSLREFYIQFLHEMGEPLTNAESISWLLWDDGDHHEKASEIIAWTLHNKTQDVDSPVEQTKEKSESEDPDSEPSHNSADEKKAVAEKTASDDSRKKPVAIENTSEDSEEKIKTETLKKTAAKSVKTPVKKKRTPRKTSKTKESQQTKATAKNSDSDSTEQKAAPKKTAKPRKQAQKKTVKKTDSADTKEKMLDKAKPKVIRRKRPAKTMPIEKETPEESVIKGETQ